MTDDIDAMLRAAGGRWQANAPATNGVSLDPNGRNSNPRRAWAMPLLAAAVVVAGTVAVFVARPFGADHAAPASDTSLQSLVVHDGDRVSATGQIFAAKFGTQLCSNIVSVAEGASPAPLIVSTGPSDGGPDQTVPNPGATNCAQFHIVNLIGLNVDQHGIGGPHGPDSVVGFGAGVTVTGIYRNGAITVDTLRSWDGKDALDLSPAPTPCATLSDGWQPPDHTVEHLSTPQADAYIASHQSVIGTSRVTVPAQRGQYALNELEVRTIGVVGDATVQNRVRADLAAVFHGLLCVYPVSNSLAMLAAGKVAATPILGSSLIEVENNPAIDKQVAHVRLLTDAQAAAMQPYVSTVAVDPHVRPIG